MKRQNTTPSAATAKETRKQKQPKSKSNRKAKAAAATVLLLTLLFLAWPRLAGRQRETDSRYKDTDTFAI